MPVGPGDPMMRPKGKKKAKGKKVRGHRRSLKMKAKAK